MAYKKKHLLVNRVKASFVDAVILIFLGLVFSQVLSSFTAVDENYRVLAFVLILSYEPIFVSLFGNTIGHFLNGIKVERLNSHKKLNIFSSTLRYLMKLLLGWISLLTIGFTKNSQAIHDMISHSTVVERKK